VTRRRIGSRTLRRRCRRGGEGCGPPRRHDRQPATTFPPSTNGPHRRPARAPICLFKNSDGRSPRPPQAPEGILLERAAHADPTRALAVLRAASGTPIARSRWSPRDLPLLSKAGVDRRGRDPPYGRRRPNWLRMSRSTRRRHPRARENARCADSRLAPWTSPAWSLRRAAGSTGVSWPSEAPSPRQTPPEKNRTPCKRSRRF